MIHWDYFKKVRKIDVAKWCKNLNITTYEMFVKRVEALGVFPTTREEFEKMIPKKIVKIEKKTVLPVLILEKMPEGFVSQTLPIDIREISVLDDVREKKKTKKKSESVEPE